MKLFLHIGTEKTGTTTLQSFLYQNRHHLKIKGVHVLTSAGKGNNRGLSSYAMRNDRFDDFHASHGISTKEQRVTFDKRIERSVISELENLDDNIHTVIISSEHFQSRCTHIEEINKINDFFRIFFDKIEVIIYLRPQIDMATSLYSTLLRGSCSIDFRDFIFNDCIPENQYYDYYSLLEKWRSVFGDENISPRIFEKEELIHGDLICDFFNIIGSSREGLKEVKNQNESLTPLGQEILRLNNELKKSGQLKNNPYLYSHIKKYAIRKHTGKGQLLSSADAQNIQEKFSEINDLTAKKWFGRKELFTLDYKKYGKGIDIPKDSKEVLAVIFSSQIEVFSELYKSNKKTLNEELPPKLSPNEINIIRDAAINFEKVNLKTSLSLMNIALKLRPNGKLIQNKIKQYKKLLHTKN